MALASCATQKGPVYTDAIQPEEGYALVYVFRTYSQFGDLLSAKVLLNEEIAGSFHVNGYIACYLKQGNHDLRVKMGGGLSNKTDESVSISLSSEGTYYYKFGVETLYDNQFGSAHKAFLRPTKKSHLINIEKYLQQPCSISQGD